VYLVQWQISRLDKEDIVARFLAGAWIYERLQACTAVCRDLHSSGMLRGIGGFPTLRNNHLQAPSSQEELFLDCVMLEDGRDRFSWNAGVNSYQPTLHNMSQQREIKILYSLQSVQNNCRDSFHPAFYLEYTGDSFPRGKGGRGVKYVPFTSLHFRGKMYGACDSWLNDTH